MIKVGDIMHIQGATLAVVDAALVTVDYWKTVRQHGKEVKIYSPYQYTAVTVKNMTKGDLNGYEII